MRFRPRARKTWAALHAKGGRFVTRLRTTSPTRIIEELPVTPGNKVLIDWVVRVRGRLSHTHKNPLDHDLREAHVVIETGKTLRLVTNDLVSPAETIADLYNTRWEIALFFRWIKQTLKIRKFLGTSKNAVRIQIAVALIAYLLLRIAHAAQSTVPSLLAFARLIRTNLMHLRPMLDLAKPPPRKFDDPNQQERALC